MTVSLHSSDFPEVFLRLSRLTIIPLLSIQSLRVSQDTINNEKLGGVTATVRYCSIY